MGLTNVTTEPTSLGSARDSCGEVFLVNPGGADSMVAADEKTDKTGIVREGKAACELADDTAKEYRYGLARIEFMGEVTAGRVIFGEPGIEPLLGMPTLESVGIVVGPVNRRSNASRRFR